MLACQNSGFCMKEIAGKGNAYSDPPWYNNSKKGVLHHAEEVPGEARKQIDYNTLKKENSRIVHILQIICLSEIISNTPRSKRLEILADFHAKLDHYSVSELCEAMDIAKGTFYKHIFRKADRTKYSQEQKKIRLQVQQAFDDSKQRYIVTQELGLVSIRENAKRN